jgi:hypothetical protein
MVIRTGSAQNHHVVRIETSTPIGSTVPVGLVSLGIGLVLALHTPAWVILLQYKAEEDGAGGDNHNDETNQALIRKVLEGLSFIVLDLTPKVASTGLSIFLAGLFLYLGTFK